MLAWYDLPLLAMYRSRVSSFNHAQLLTYGNPIGFSALTTRLNVVEEASAEAISSEDGNTWIAQVRHTVGERSASLTFIAPGPAEKQNGVDSLLDFLCSRAGEMGAANLLAEVHENDSVLETFRHCGFSIYGWETIWRLPACQPETKPDGKNSWQEAKNGDEITVRTLYHTLVPPLVQSAEPYSGNSGHRFVYRKNNGDALAFVELQAGPKGIYIKPVIHPSLENPRQMLGELLLQLQGAGKPVYLQMRSYQAWLTAALEECAAEPIVHFLLMTRHLAVTQLAPAEKRRVKLENRQAETTLPIVQNITHSSK